MMYVLIFFFAQSVVSEIVLSMEPSAFKAFFTVMLPTSQALPKHRSSRVILDERVFEIMLQGVVKAIDDAEKYNRHDEAMALLQQLNRMNVVITRKGNQLHWSFPTARKAPAIRLVPVVRSPGKVGDPLPNLFDRMADNNDPKRSK
jgi:hypothetical protein